MTVGRLGDSPREVLSRERALQAAVELADSDGLAAVSMRKLAQNLGVEAMSLYYHVPNKASILDGMVDIVFGEIALPEPGMSWRPAMRERAESMRNALSRHPWALTLMESRVDPGPNTLTHHDAVTGCLLQSGFTIAQAAHTVALLDSFIYGFALQEMTLPFDSSNQAEVIDEITAKVSPTDYPNLMRMAREHVTKPGYSFGDEFEFGLAIVLAGIEDHVLASEAQN